SLVHSHGKGAGLYGRLAARITGVPAIHTFHGIHFERYAAPARAAYLALERRLSAWTAIVVNVSRTQEREGLALRLFTERQSRVVQNGVDVARLTATALDRREARRELGLPGDAMVVGTVARFDAVKHLDVLLRAVAAALARLAGDAAARAALCAENRMRARSEFDAREMVGALHALYGEVLGV